MPPPAYDLSKYGFEPKTPSKSYDLKAYGFEPKTATPGLGGFQVASRHGSEADYQKSLQGTSPGRDPAEGLQRHPGISFGQRALVKNLAGSDVEVAKRHLRNLGYEIQETPGYEAKGFNVILRKPGEKEWKTLDPTTFDWEDLTDVLGGTATTAAEIAGGVGGGFLGTFTPPGAQVVTVPAGAAAGAGIAGGATEAGLMGLGKALGLDPSLQEFKSSVTQEALTGAAGELGGRALVGGAKLAGQGAKKFGEAARGAVVRGRLDPIDDKLALRAELLKGKQAGLDFRKADIQVEKAGQGASRAGITEDAARVRAETQQPIAEFSRAKADLAEASLRAQSEAEASLAAENARATARKVALEKELAEEAAKAPAEAAEATAGTAAKAPGGATRAADDADVITLLENAAARQSGAKNVTFSRGLDMLDPRYSWNAASLRKNPHRVQFLNEVWGGNFLNPDGSFSMAARTSYIADLFRQAGNPAAQAALNKQWEQAAARYLLTRDIADTLSGPARQALKTIAGPKGAGDLAEGYRQVLGDLIEGYVKSKAAPEYLTRAKSALRQTRPPAMSAQATRSEAAVGLNERRAGLSGQVGETRRREFDFAERQRLLDREAAALKQRQAKIDRFDLLYGKSKVDPATHLPGKLGLARATIRALTDPTLRGVGKAANALRRSKLGRGAAALDLRYPWLRKGAGPLARRASAVAVAGSLRNRD